MDSETFINGNNEIIDYWGYLKTIDWADPWLILLIITHVVITTIVATTRRHSLFQMILFLMMLLGVCKSRRINELAADHWELFSRQQYFDNKGLFISTVFSMPILLNCMMMISNWLHTATELVSTMRVTELKASRRKLGNEHPINCDR